MTTYTQCDRCGNKDGVTKVLRIEPKPQPSIWHAASITIPAVNLGGYDICNGCVEIILKDFRK